MEDTLHMNGGHGDLSYAKNSTIQQVIVCMTKDARQEAVLEWFCSKLPDCITIADLGCSSGPNTLLVTSDIIEAVEQRCRQLGRQCPEFQVFLNDLPMNDFNTIFSYIPELQRQRGEKLGRCFISGTPGSFYGRLFSSRSLHFVHSSSSLHWLSQVPVGLNHDAKMSSNIGKLYISKESPPYVLNEYLKQFQRDFSMFLKYRAEEMVASGCMVLTLMGRRASDPSTRENCYMWDLLGQALMDMALQDLVSREKVNSFNAPYYAPSAEEVKNVILSEGSFTVKSIKIFEASWESIHNPKKDGVIKKEGDFVYKEQYYAYCMGKGIRAVLESMLVSHFGESIIDEMFTRYTSLLEEYYSENRAGVINLSVSLVRNT